jgi:zinc protease
MFLVNAPVQTDRTGESLRELVNELDAIQSERPVSDQEMTRVINGLTRALPGNYETSQAVLNSLVSSARYGRPLDFAAHLTENYQALQLNDLQSAAVDLVDSDKLVWIVVGDLSRIRSQIEALDMGPIEIWNDDGEPVTP